ncbi:chondroitin proteoglycan 2-like isoform X1 [Actinia tenebrosa]|uniref:Chondroitin proteoglycan 2-like isoform X1 n=1 Tax=Actinia tenebrosa TaxID=6105 RepID=A0A6P8I5Q4_ACTTE|nr:chondroitin proteoglycan 2-like isoform X1 [Actinia tenebrosa]
MKFLLTILVVIFVSSSAEDMLKELDDELYLDLLQQEGTKDGTVKADDIVGMQWNDKKDDGQNSSSTTFCKDKPNGNYPNPFKCEGFIMCSNHLTYFFDCPSILQYNPKTDRCDWPRNVNCGPAPRPTNTPRPPKPSPSNFCKNRPNGNYVDPNNCNGFIMCSNHLTYFFHCPANLRYNVKTDRCDWPRNVKCGPTPQPTGQPTKSRPTVTPSPSTFCRNRADGNYVDPNNCNGFIMCSNHRTYFFDCPANLRYNAKTDRCDWPWNVKCGPTPRPTRRPRPPTPSPSTFCKNRPNGNYVDPNNCNGFIMCSNHLTYFFDCPANLRYNAKTDRCDWPRNVKCNSLSDDISSDTNARRSKFCMNHGNGNYRDITNCEGYITCFRGYMFYRECPGTLRFNPLTRRCDLPRNVKCAGAGGGTRGSGFCKKRANGDYKDVLNCNDFIKCSNGYTYYFDCPSDLRFNENTDRCDWPRNVPCNY